MIFMDNQFYYVDSKGTARSYFWLEFREGFCKVIEKTWLIWLIIFIYCIV